MESSISLSLIQTRLGQPGKSGRDLQSESLSHLIGAFENTKIVAQYKFWK